jgi:hypothetical protein
MNRIESLSTERVAVVHHDSRLSRAEPTLVRWLVPSESNLPSSPKKKGKGGGVFGLISTAFKRKKETRVSQEKIDSSCPLRGEEPPAPAPAPAQQALADMDTTDLFKEIDRQRRDSRRLSNPSSVSSQRQPSNQSSFSSLFGESFCSIGERVSIKPERQALTDMDTTDLFKEIERQRIDSGRLSMQSSVSSLFGESSFCSIAEQVSKQSNHISSEDLASVDAASRNSIEENKSTRESKRSRSGSEIARVGAISRGSTNDTKPKLHHSDSRRSNKDSEEASAITASRDPLEDDQLGWESPVYVPRPKATLDAAFFKSQLCSSPSLSGPSLSIATSNASIDSSNLESPEPTVSSLDFSVASEVTSSPQKVAKLKVNTQQTTSIPIYFPTPPSHDQFLEARKSTQQDASATTSQDLKPNLTGKNKDVFRRSEANLGRRTTSDMSSSVKVESSILSLEERERIPPPRRQLSPAPDSRLRRNHDTLSERLTLSGLSSEERERRSPKIVSFCSLLNQSDSDMRRSLQRQNFYGSKSPSRSMSHVRNILEETHPVRPAPPPATVEVAPGVFEPLRSAAETWKAIETGNIVGAVCLSCNFDLHCVDDAKYVLCPSCRVVGPVETSLLGFYGQGIGLGITAIQLSRWRAEIEAAR